VSDVLSDLAAVADHLKAMPELDGFKRRAPDECIDRETWTVWLRGSWRVDDAGHGDTIQEAYQNALENRARLQMKAAA
jgi:hypothetical protein